MKFRAPEGSGGVSVGLTSGHTLFIKDDEEGTETEPRFRLEAIKRGCKPVGVGADAPEQKKEPTKDELIEQAIEKLLDSDEADAFTADGRPNVTNLSKMAGFTVTAAERDAVWQKMQDSGKAE